MQCVVIDIMDELLFLCYISIVLCPTKSNNIIMENQCTNQIRETNSLLFYDGNTLLTCSAEL